ncbi:Aconitate hydratase A [Nymphon striatum]|nr:Aconitate hydratase A [Nymphon striatum]
MLNSLDSFKCKSTMTVNGKEFTYYSLAKAEQNGLAGISNLPFSLKVLLENLLRFEDGRSVTKENIQAVADWLNTKGSAETEIAYRPARVLMQDFTGVPAVVDLAAMRDATKNLGGDTAAINPQVPCDLVIDHSVMVDFFANSNAFTMNVDREYERNGERYTFLKWGQEAFDNFRVVPPGTGICHQVNLENLAQTVWTKDIDVGTDSHTTMVNGLSVLGWGVGGIEAEAAMLGQPITMLVPEVIGFELTGSMTDGTTATDLVLTVVEMLRQKGVVGKFVEFYGSGLSNLSLEDQATIANMAPEYGATCGFFPVDVDSIKYLKDTGRDADRVALVEAYAKEQGMWRADDTPDPVFSSTLSLAMGDVVPSISGPKRPQDRVTLAGADVAFAEAAKAIKSGDIAQKGDEKRYDVEGSNYKIDDGDVVIAAITSCTNTSNPSVMIGAGLLARNARAKGLTVKPWVKTSLAPGSQIVTDYLEKANLQDDLDAMGFNLVGYGCTTCIGNSGPLPEPISNAINSNDVLATSVLSGNRNFEGRVSPDCRANYLASPPLVVAYAIAGSMHVDITKEALGQDPDGNDVFLKDIWPSTKEIADLIRTSINEDMFHTRYGNAFKGDAGWQEIEVSGGETYNWSDESTYVQYPPYFDGMSMEPDAIEDIKGARILGLFADSITTDHISPAGSFKADTPAGGYLTDRQVRPIDFNSYGSRRGNHEIMMRGTFANIRIKNQMLSDVEGGFSKHYPSGDQAPMYDVAMRYKEEGTPLVIFAGKEYGTAFERIHRSNLIGMGVLPLVFTNGDSWEGLGMKGDEQLTLRLQTGSQKSIELLVRIDTEDELDYYKAGGILHYVLRNLNRAA